MSVKLARYQLVLPISIDAHQAGFISLFRRGFSGELRDERGGLPYGFRTYSPGIGRWLSPDPAETAGAERHPLNFYAMVDGNPATYRDRKGLVTHDLFTSDDALNFLRLLNRLNTPNAVRLILDYVNSPLPHPLLHSLIQGFARQYGLTDPRLLHVAQHLIFRYANPVRLFSSSRRMVFNQAGNRLDFTYYSEWLTQAFINDAFRTFDSPVIGTGFPLAVMQRILLMTHEEEFSHVDVAHIDSPAPFSELQETTRHAYSAFMRGFRPQILGLSWGARSQIFTAWFNHVKSTPFSIVETDATHVGGEARLTLRYPPGFSYAHSKKFGVEMSIRKLPNQRRGLLDRIGVRASFGQEFRLRRPPVYMGKPEDWAQKARKLRKSLGRSYDPGGRYGIEETERTLFARLAFAVAARDMKGYKVGLDVLPTPTVHALNLQTSSLFNKVNMFDTQLDDDVGKYRILRIIGQARLLVDRRLNHTMDKRVANLLPSPNDVTPNLRDRMTERRLSEQASDSAKASSFARNMQLFLGKRLAHAFFMGFTTDIYSRPRLRFRLVFADHGEAMNRLQPSYLTVSDLQRAMEIMPGFLALFRDRLDEPGVRERLPRRPRGTPRFSFVVTLPRAPLTPRRRDPKKKRPRKE